MTKALRFELVLPCYNESKSIEKLVQRAVGAARERGLSPEEFRLVLVENGSRDNSREVLSTLKNGELGLWFRVVEVNENRGYGFGLHCGLKTTAAPIVGYSHADQQCDPRDAITAFFMIEERKTGTPAALIKGRRSGRNWKDFLVSRVFETIAGTVLNLWVFDVNAQPKVFRRDLVAELECAPNDFAFDLYALYRARKLGWQIETIPVLFPPRIHGFSNWAHSFRSRFKTIRKIIEFMFSLQRREGRL